MFTQARMSAFTRVEFMVVLGVIGTLVGLLIPAVQADRESARRMQCSNSLKQIALAVHNYHDTYKRLPSGWLAPHPDDPTNAGSWAWGMMIIPFME